MDPTEYERLTAIVTHATIKMSVTHAFPDLSMGDQDAMIIGVIDRLARLRGWSIRREHIMSEDDSE